MEVNSLTTSATLNDVNVVSIKSLLKPNTILSEIPITQQMEYFIEKKRNEVRAILTGEDDRKIIVVGPCSIHDMNSAMEYGERLKVLGDRVKDKILIIMRVYFEKPRTTVGWKGLINDPDLDNTYNINKGLMMARKLLYYLNSIGVPCGYEVLDTFTPQYIGDLVTWGAIGARTTESQVHRQLVSGLSMPVGFKNNSSGDYDIATNAIISAAHEHCFYGINKEGGGCIVTTSGNQYCHMILRGSIYSTNYDERSVKAAKESMANKKLSRHNVMIDCSHGNSCKDYRNQPKVMAYLCEQFVKNKDYGIGVMLESNINEGKQKLIFGEKEKLKYGVSITDCCMSFGKTEEVIMKFYSVL
jgi:3-deoxy-7-phosphoheptulonate synthase